MSNFQSPSLDWQFPKNRNRFIAKPKEKDRIVSLTKRGLSRSIDRAMRMSRTWAMPTKDTFQCPPIGAFARRYLVESEISIDPFARNCSWATITNDPNPDTDATYHMDAKDFLVMVRDKGTKPDLAIFDPPYSPRQVKECYDSVGLKMGIEGGQRTHGWTEERDIINEMLGLGGDRVVVRVEFHGHGEGQGLRDTRDTLGVSRGWSQRHHLHGRKESAFAGFLRLT